MVKMRSLLLFLVGLSLVLGQGSSSSTARGAEVTEDAQNIVKDAKILAKEASEGKSKESLQKGEAAQQLLKDTEKLAKDVKGANLTEDEKTKIKKQVKQAVNAVKDTADIEKKKIEKALNDKVKKTEEKGKKVAEEAAKKGKKKAEENAKEAKKVKKEASPETEAETTEAETTEADSDGETTDDSSSEESSDDETYETYVEILTTSDFKPFIKKHKFVLVMFHAPWCGHCKKMLPEFEKAAEALKTIQEQGIDVKLAKVDDTVHKNLATVEGYPTLKWYVDGYEDEAYGGSRSEPGISEWIIDEVTPPYLDITRAGLREITTSAEFVIVGSGSKLSKEGSKKGEKFKQFAKPFKSNQRFKFYKVTDSKKRTAKITLYRQNYDAEVDGPKSVTFTEKKWNKKVLMNWLQKETEYLLNRQDNAKEIAGRLHTKAVILMCVETMGIRLERFHDLAKKLREDGYKFCVSAIVDDNKDAGCVLNDDGVGTALLIGQTKKNKKGKVVPTGVIHSFPSPYAFTVDGIHKLLAAVKADKIPRFIKSEDVPDVDRYHAGKGAGVLVGSQFHKVVYDQASDSLVEFYAPWCKHCKKYAPKYEEIAKQIKKKFYDKGKNIRVLKFNAIDNEYPKDIVKKMSFPTILLFPGGRAAKKKKAVLLDEAYDREKIEEIIEFIEMNSYALTENGGKKCNARWKEYQKEVEEAERKKAEELAKEGELPEVEDEKEL